MFERPRFGRFSATLCFPIKGREVLLGFKMRDIGENHWNGYGGGIETGETPEAAAIRELWEEAGLMASTDAIEKGGIVDFHNLNADKSDLMVRVHVYIVRQWIGELKPTEEMARPTWFDIDHLPFNEMQDADRVWLPAILDGRKIYAEVVYSPDGKLAHEVEVKKLSEADL